MVVMICIVKNMLTVLTSITELNSGSYFAALNGFVLGLHQKSVPVAPSHSRDGCFAAGRRAERRGGEGEDEG